MLPIEEHEDEASEEEENEEAVNTSGCSESI
jgi:hypothetical protein